MIGLRADRDIQDQHVFLRERAQFPAEIGPVQADGRADGLLNLVGHRQLVVDANGCQRVRQRHESILADNDQLGTHLGDASATHGRTDPVHADKRPCAGGRRVVAPVDGNLSFRGQEYQMIVHAVSGIDRPCPQCQQVPAASGLLRLTAFLLGISLLILWLVLQLSSTCLQSSDEEGTC